MNFAQAIYATKKLILSTRQLGHNNLSLDSLGNLLSSLPSLANLGLEHNQIETLTDRLFQGNTQLAIL